MTLPYYVFLLGRPMGRWTLEYYLVAAISISNEIGILCPYVLQWQRLALLRYREYGRHGALHRPVGGGSTLAANVANNSSSTKSCWRTAYCMSMV
ncbi:MAG: hypothetical protein JF615_12215 [Asticcacaulis sp.]|nr:hypothetical protein [Asticcacaulis sp.]